MTIFLFLGFLVSSPELLQIYDGDTIHAKTAGGFELKVRLIGIDCPEVPHKASRGKKSQPGQPGGIEAQKRLSELLKDGFEIRPYGLDAFGRTLGEIELKDKRRANLILVEEGFCEVYRKGNKSKRRKAASFDLQSYDRAESLARAAKRGIWGMAHYEAPGNYRRRVSR